MFKTRTMIKLIFLLPVLCCQTPVANDAKSLVEQMVEAIGGQARLYALKDVEYRYTYNDVANGKKDVSIERYVFDGELSWAKYVLREKFGVPDQSGEVLQGYNGRESWATLDGQLLTDPQVLKLADFARKTNYYWFMMMFKLLDPGLTYEYQGTKSVAGIDYDIVRVTFDEGIGDVQDTYVLYLNPQTHLVDQFLFTVMDFGMADPLLMKVEYDEVQGLKLPTKRIYAPADWDGVPKQDVWTEEISEEIKFNNGFNRAMFNKPSQ